MSTFGGITLRDVMDMPIPELAAWWNMAQAINSRASNKVEG